MADNQENTRNNSPERQARAGRQSQKNQSGNQRTEAGRRGSDASNSGRSFTGMNDDQQRETGRRAARGSFASQEFDLGEASRH